MGMLKIRIDRREQLDRALKQFKRICNDAGIFKRIKKTTYYEKPSARRRREEQQREKNIHSIGRRPRRPARYF